MAPIPRCDLRVPNESGGKPSSLTTSSTGTDDKRPHEKRPGVRGAPIHSQRSRTRDSAEILEGAVEFSTGLTRDIAEIRDHKLHEGTGADDLEGRPTDDPCTGLQQCRAGRDQAAAAAAAAVSDEEDVTFPKPTAAPTVEPVATPGDICSRFCKDRPESPSSGYDLRKAIGDEMVPQKKGAKTCKERYALLETYTSLWGSSKALNARKKRELEMKKKRKYFEYLHERNKKRREKEKLKFREKRRMMRCKDQSKIRDTIDDISINKAFYFRFNYNKQLPFMPSTMNQHLQKFKKPPFKHFLKASLPCHKQVDEFEKLRVTEIKTGHSKAS